MMDHLLFAGAIFAALASLALLWKQGSWPGPWPVRGEPVILGLLGALVYLAFQVGAVLSFGWFQDDVAAFHLSSGVIRVVCIVVLALIVRNMVHSLDPMHVLKPRSLRDVVHVVLPYLLLLPLMFLVTPQGNQKAIEDLAGLNQFYPRISMFFSIVVAAPILEELLFRGFLQGALRRAYPASVSLPLAAGLFAMVHEVGVQIPVFFLGLLLGVVYEKTRAFWAPLLLHALHNLITFVFIISGGTHA